MKAINKKLKRIFAILIAIAVLVPTFLFTTSEVFNNKIDTKKEVTMDDKKTANDISNMTGAKTEDILKLKASGKSWNDILNELKQPNNGDKEKQTNDINSQDYMKKLTEEGFQEEEIRTTKMLVERVVFGLKEITSNKEQITPTSILENSDSNQKDDSSKYHELINKINSEKAIYLSLKGKKDFKNVETALNEYLYSLQIDIDFESYFIDKTEYLKQKQEKSITLNIEEVITIEKIESKMLENIQTQNEKNKTKTDNNLINQNNNNKEKDEDLPKVPDINDIKPKDPLADVMKEINEIKNKNITNLKKALKELEIPETYRDKIKALIKKGYRLPDILIAYNFLNEYYGKISQIEGLLEKNKNGKTWDVVFNEYTMNKGEFIPTNFDKSYIENLIKTDGISADDIMIADRMAFNGTKKFDELIDIKKTGKNWKDIKVENEIINMEEK